MFDELEEAGTVVFEEELDDTGWDELEVSELDEDEVGAEDEDVAGGMYLYTYAL